MATTTLRVGGMTCGACTSAVESGFKNVDGAGSVTVGLVTERAVVLHDPDKLSAEQIQEIIEDRGFDAEILATDMPQKLQNRLDGKIEERNAGSTSMSLATTTVSVGGMTCGACTSAVEGAFKGVPGLKSFSISLLSERAVLEHDVNLLSPERIAEIIDDTGFDASIVDSQRAPTDTRIDRLGGDSRVLVTTVAIDGMTCGACTSGVENGFKDLPGLVQFNISLLAERAVITHDATLLPPARILDIIEDRGFDASMVSSVDAKAQATSSQAVAHLKTYGLPDIAAARSLESSLQQLSGVSSATVNFKTLRATITYKRKAIGLRTIVQAVEDAGYNALIADADDNNAQLESLAKTKEIQEWRHAFRTSLAFAIPVFFIGMVIPNFIPVIDINKVELISGLWLGDIISLALTIPVQFGIGKRFYVSAYKSLKHGAPTMDVLVVLGTSAAFFFSIAAMLVSLISSQHSKPGTVFETSTMLITFITLGRYLENRAKGQTSRALSRLMSLAPSMASIYTDPLAAIKAAESWSSNNEKTSEKAIKSGQEMIEASHTNKSLEERSIPTELIEVGDVVILRPGDKIPADGNVISGESYVDESMITGEAMPLQKKKGSTLLAGTVNMAGKLDFTVTRAGRDTQLSQIVHLVQEAQTSRAPIQRLADLVAGYFVPVIISLAVATFIVWIVLSHVLAAPPHVFTESSSGGKLMVCLKLCISVIVFACPCALGLSTPTAVMVGTGVGAENGILIKGGAALETATKVSHVVFDKTGTLTVGKMSVSDKDISVEWSGSDAQKRLWWTLVALAEMSSEHPVARAIVRTAKEELSLGPEGAVDGSTGSFDVVVGKGVIATCQAAISPNADPYQMVMGNLKHLRDEGVHIPEFVVQAENRVQTEAELSKSPSVSFSSSKNAIVDQTTQRAATASSSTSTSASAGLTRIHIAIDGTYAGSLALSDTVKPAAQATVAALNRLGVSCSIVTGDQLPSALAVAAEVGIPPSAVHAGATPSTKQDIIASMQESEPEAEFELPRQLSFSYHLRKYLPFTRRFYTKLNHPSSLSPNAPVSGCTVAMIGDGINDSPALATANVGIALSSGTDVAVEAADIVLMNSDDLLAVPASLHLARAILNRIRLNLGWACVYNLIGLPFAMGFFLPWGYRLHPMAAAAAMAMSSVSVVLSSLALKWWRRPDWLAASAHVGGLAIEVEEENAEYRAATTKKRRTPSWTAKTMLPSFVRRALQLNKGSNSYGNDDEEDTQGRKGVRYVPLRDMTEV